LYRVRAFPENGGTERPKKLQFVTSAIIPLFSPSVKPWERQKSEGFPVVSGVFDGKRLLRRIQCATTGLEIGDKIVNFYNLHPKFGLTGAGKGV
jgi:hypothetical protein